MDETFPKSKSEVRRLRAQGVVDKYLEEENRRLEKECAAMRERIEAIQVSCPIGGPCMDCDTVQSTQSFMLYSQHQEIVGKLEAACAEMRAVLMMVRDHMNGALAGSDCELSRQQMEMLENALSPDAGKGWVSPEGHIKAKAEVDAWKYAAEHNGQEADYWKKALEQALAERDQAKSDLNNWQVACEVADAKYQQARAEAAAAVDWVGKARHFSYCSWRPCTCGRKEALNGTAAKALLEEVVALRAVRDAAEEVRRTREEALPNSGCQGMCFIPKYEWDELCAALDAAKSLK